METGQISNNSLRYINLTKIHDYLGSTQALPAFHAFSGCDYEASFYGKGKKTPFTILKNCNQTRAAFASSGQIGMCY